MRVTPLSTLIGLLLLLGCVPKAGACVLVCFVAQSPSADLAGAEAVFVGRVTAIAWDRDPELGILLPTGKASIATVEVFKGAKSRVYELSTGPAESCHYPMSEGESHLLFLRAGDKDGAFEIIDCAPNGLLERAVTQATLRTIRAARLAE